MSDDQVLTSSYCTNWGAYNTPRLWAMVAGEDDPEAWRQVAAWGDVASSVKDHRARLERARDSLAAAWPPGQNKSADVFLTEFDKLLGRMDEAKVDADTTATGLANILEELRQAKNDLQPLYEEYKSKNSDLIPGWVDSAEDELDEKARNRMVAAERVVEMHVAQIKVPTEYRMDPNARSGFKPSDTERTAGGGSLSGAGAGAGVGSSGVGSSGSGSSGSGSSGSGAGSGSSFSGVSSFEVPHDPPPTLNGQDSILPGGGGGTGDPGLGLAGVTPPVPPPAPPIPPPGNPGVPPVIGGPLPPGPPVPPILPGPLPGGGGGGIGGYGIGNSGGNLGKPTLKAGGVRGAMPSGAVIGETIGGPGRGGAGGVGGVGSVGGAAGTGGRGPNASARGPAGRPGTGKPIRPSWLPPDEPGAGGRSGAAMAGTGRRGERGEESDGEGRQFDPDNPWEVDSGVAPVIRPRPQTGRHDPGPNVIGGYRG